MARAWASALAALLLLGGPGCSAEGEPAPAPAATEAAEPPPAPAETELGVPPPAPAETELGRFRREGDAGALDDSRAAGAGFTGADWRTATPESQGLDPVRLARGIERVRGLSGARSLLVVRNARIVAEASFAGPDLNRRPHDVKSASKSLLSALVGIALEEGWIDGLDASIARLLPRYAEGLAPEKRAITLADVLAMSPGLASTSGEHYGAWVSSGDWTRAALARPMTAAPGEEFSYSTGSSHLVSAILTEASGKSTLELARERLLGPVGIEVHSWQRAPEGYYLGGNSVRMTPRDLARLGQLYLQEGSWNGRQVVPASWVRESTRRHAEGWPWRYGAYGYFWWLPPDDPWDSYAAVGYGGQFLYVVPELRMLLVMTSTLAGKGEAWDEKALAIFREEIFGSAR
jgi:CubicO group peptidase (beta-lactamase class C family)